MPEFRGNASETKKELPTPHRIVHIPALLPTSTSIFEKTFSGPLPGSLGNVTKQYSDPPPAIAIEPENQEKRGIFSLQLLANLIRGGEKKTFIIQEETRFHPIHSSHYIYQRGATGEEETVTNKGKKGKDWLPLKVHTAWDVWLALRNLNVIVKELPWQCWWLFTLSSLNSAPLTNFTPRAFI